MKDNEALLSIPRVVFCVDWQDVFVGMSVSPDEIKFPLMLLSWEFAFQCAQSSDWTLAQTLNKLSAEQCFKSFRVEKVTRNRNSPFCDLAMRCVVFISVVGRRPRSEIWKLEQKIFQLKLQTEIFELCC